MADKTGGPAFPLPPSEHMWGLMLNGAKTHVKQFLINRIDLKIAVMGAIKI